MPSPPASPTPAPTAPPSAAPQPTTPILEREFDEKPFSLIDGRLLVQMPEGTQDIARQQSIMGAKKTNRAETRLVLDGYGQQLVLYARETYYQVDDLQAEADTIVKRWYGNDFTYRIDSVRQSGDGLAVLRYSPEKIDTSTEAVLISGAFARTNDGALIFLGVYVTPDTAKNLELCQKLAARVLESVRSGARKIDVSAREEQLSESDLTIKLDEGYALVQDEGADFTVFYLMKLVKLGEPAPSIGIYVGAHPSPMYKGRGIEDSKLTKTQDTILNKKVEWLSYKPYPDKDYYSAEVLIDLSDFTKIHIFVDAVNEAEFLTIKEMIDTLKTK